MAWSRSRVLLLGALALGSAAFVFRPWPTREQPKPRSELLFPGITYQRGARSGPNPLVWHALTVELTHPGLESLVTPGDPKAPRPLRAQTTSAFLAKYHCQVAVNGDWFYPWRSSGPWDYYPHENDEVSVEGEAISRGVRYAVSDGHPHLTTLYLTRDGHAQIGGKAPKEVWSALGGHKLSLESPSDSPDRQPRTTIGVDRLGRRLCLLVVDGRQKGYSEGATEAELAGLLKQFGATTAINLDGGGSATMVVERAGKPVVLNTPIDQKQAGKERLIANHLGFFAPSARASGH